MLRDEGHQPQEAPTALSAEARLLLHADHYLGLHLDPVDDCDWCTPLDGPAPAGKTAPAVS